MATKNISKIVFLAIFFVAIVLLVPVWILVGNLYGKNTVSIIVVNPNNQTTNVVDTIKSASQKIELGLPETLTIPSIKVDAKVVYVGLASDGSVDVPKDPYQVAWFKLGPRPGEIGSAVIAGHFGPWQTGAHSVFDDLHKLKVGDTIYVKDSKGAIISFMVRESRIYNSNDSPPEVFNKNDRAHLNLIACTGTWIPEQKTYTQRLVVFADATS